MFDSKQELLERIRFDENSALELSAVAFKGQRPDHPSVGELADELAAFANGKGGVLVLGVDERTREILGIPLDRLDAVESFVQEACNSIEPPLTAEIIRMELPDSGGADRAILKVDVPQSLFVHKSPHGYFRRLGSSKREMPTDLLLRLGQQRSQTRIIRFEEQPVPNTTLADLSPPLYERFTSRSNEPAETVLLKRNLLRRDESGDIRASVAGVLMCSEFPDKHLTGAFIEAVRYRGTLQDSNYQHDAQRIRGPLDEQIRQATRNELITSLLAESPVAETTGDVQRAYYMEKRGDGVPIILRESKALSSRKPEYRLIDDSELLLTIFAAKS